MNFRDLDEIPEVEIKAELNRREHQRAMGVCDYCGFTSNQPTCKFPERHGWGDTQKADITIDPTGKVLLCRMEQFRPNGAPPKVCVVKDLQAYQHGLFGDEWGGYDVVVDREAHVLMSRLDKLPKVCIVGSVPSYFSSASAYEGMSQAVGSTQPWASFGIDRSVYETTLEMQLRAEKARVLLGWDDRRSARLKVIPVLRRCRECSGDIPVEENGILAPHLRNFGHEHCLGTGCTCPEDKVLRETDPRTISVHIDGNCVVHGVKGSKASGS